MPPSNKKPAPYNVQMTPRQRPAPSSVPWDQRPIPGSKYTTKELRDGKPEADRLAGAFKKVEGKKRGPGRPRTGVVKALVKLSVLPSDERLLQALADRMVLTRSQVIVRGLQELLKDPLYKDLKAN